jgi:hypothetical protein
MFATREFVLVHVPKSGGEFIKFCMGQTGESFDLGSHTPFRDMPPEFRGLPAVTFKRNPWDWYVSAWHHRQIWETVEETFPEFIHKSFRGPPPDSYTWMFGQIAGIDGCRRGLVEWGRFETLREDFVAFLDRHAVGDDALREMVLTHTPLNVSENRRHYRDYYTEELRDIVATSRMARHYEF